MPAWKAPKLRGSDAVCGLILGTLLGLCLSDLVHGVLWWFDADHFVPLAAILGMLAAVTRLRTALWVASALVAAAVAIVGYTPLVPTLMPHLIRSDSRRAAPVVVVLSSSIHEDGSLTSTAQARFLHAYELLRQGYARGMVVTRMMPPLPSYAPAARRQMQQLGLENPIDEIGPVTNTHDEAVATARLSREREWREVILVSHPWHLRRAGAVFEKAGVHVQCSPCAEGDYDLSSLNTVNARLRACGESKEMG